MEKLQLLAMKRVNEITIGKVINIFYVKATDIIVIVEENPHDEFSPFKHYFGSKADGLKELLEALKEYYIETLNEKLDVFNEIYERMGP